MDRLPVAGRQEPKQPLRRSAAQLIDDHCHNNDNADDDVGIRVGNLKQGTTITNGHDD